MVRACGEEARDLGEEVRGQKERARWGAVRGTRGQEEEVTELWAQVSGPSHDYGRRQPLRCGQRGQKAGAAAQAPRAPSDPPRPAPAPRPHRTYTRGTDTEAPTCSRAPSGPDPWAPPGLRPLTCTQQKPGPVASALELPALPALPRLRAPHPPPASGTQGTDQGTAPAPEPTSPPCWDRGTFQQRHRQAGERPGSGEAPSFRETAGHGDRRRDAPGPHA